MSAESAELRWLLRKLSLRCSHHCTLDVKGAPRSKFTLLVLARDSLQLNGEGMVRVFPDNQELWWVQPDLMRKRVVFFIAEGLEIWSIAGFRSWGNTEARVDCLFLALVEPKFAKSSRRKLARFDNADYNVSKVKQKCLF